MRLQNAGLPPSGGYWLWHFGAKASTAFCAVLCLGWGAVHISAQESTEKDSPPESYLDYAEIYLDRYIDPSPRLSLGEGGESQAVALAYFSKALTLEASGDSKGALEAYRIVLKHRPDEIYLARRVAYMIAREGHPGEGKALLEESLEENKDRARSYISLSEYLATFYGDEVESRKKALSLAEEAVEKFPSDPAVYDHLVTLFLVERKVDKARATLEKALETENDDPDYWLRLGQIAQRVWPINEDLQQTPDRINAIYDKVLDIAGDDPDYVEEVADYYSLSHQYDRSRDLYESIIAEHPESLEIRRKLARVYSLLDQEDEVVRTLEELVQIDSEDLESHKFLARMYEDRNELEKAVEHHQRAFRLAKGTVNEYLEAAQLMMRAQQPGEAAVLLERAAFHYPDSPEVVYLLAISQSYSKNYDESLSNFAKAAELATQGRPGLLGHQFYYEYAVAAERDRQFERASDLFRKSIELLPEDADPQLTAQIYNYLGYMWLEQDMNIDEAGELIKIAYQLEPDSGAIVDSMGWFHFKKGRYEEARKELLRAEVLIENPDPVVFDHLAQTHFQLGYKEEALTYLRKALELDPQNQELAQRLREFTEKEPPVKPKPLEEPAPKADPEESPESDDAPPAKPAGEKQLNAA